MYKEPNCIGCSLMWHMWFFSEKKKYEYNVGFSKNGRVKLGVLTKIDVVCGKLLTSASKTSVC